MNEVSGHGATANGASQDGRAGVDSRAPRRRSEWLGFTAVVVVAVVGGWAVMHTRTQRSALPPPPTLPAIQVPGVSTRLVLPTHQLSAGQKVKATVVVTNATHGPIRAHGCISPFAVSLRNHRAYQVVFQAACLQTFVFPRGRSMWPVSFTVRYGACSNDPAEVPVDRSTPRCDKEGAPPVLPSGTYRAFVVSPEVISTAQPVQVSVH